MEASHRKSSTQTAKGIYTLIRLEPLIGTKLLKDISEGLIISHIRYCAPVYLCGKVRLHNSDPHNEDLNRLQVIQNKVLRVALKKKQSDHVRIEDMLHETESLSINQMVCLSILMETWKSRNITHILPDNGTRHDDRTLRSDTMNLMRTSANSTKSFLFQATNLWKLSTQRFRTTSLLKVAKNEALTLVRSLPV